MSEMIITIGEDGSITFLSNDATKGLADLGNSTTKRASHVEPVRYLPRVIFHFLRKRFGDKGWMASFTRLWPCRWRVNLSPVGGPVLPIHWRYRREAIKAEIEWLNENFL